jgi:hypothetical protein
VYHWAVPLAVLGVEAGSSVQVLFHASTDGQDDLYGWPATIDI